MLCPLVYEKENSKYVCSSLSLSWRQLYDLGGWLYNYNFLQNIFKNLQVNVSSILILREINFSCVNGEY